MTVFEITEQSAVLPEVCGAQGGISRVNKLFQSCSLLFSLCSQRLISLSHIKHCFFHLLRDVSGSLSCILDYILVCFLVFANIKKNRCIL
jgi:hypothetical protein